MNALEKGYLKKVEFARQGAFYLSFVKNAETQADTAIGTELAGHGDQFAGDIFGLDYFLRPQGMADGFKEDDAEWVFPGHRRYLVLSKIHLLRSCRRAFAARSTCSSVLKKPKLKRTVP
jgi:hypothetical protein